MSSLEMLTVGCFDGKGLVFSFLDEVGLCLGCFVVRYWEGDGGLGLP